MKKVSLLITLITILFVLSACGSGSGSTNTTSTDSASTNSFRNSTSGNRPLNPESKLALGTIKLEGTRQAVDPKMAANLLPLWQLLFQLNSSSSSAPQEVAAVVDQIQTTMTPEQIKTINSMQMTQADIFTVFQQQAQANGSGGTTNSGGNRGNGGGFIFGGGGPGGGGPGGGFGGGFRNNGGAGSSTTTQASSAQTAAQTAQARQNALSNLVINQVIRLLETKLRS
jgi:hypothetical protein